MAVEPVVIELEPGRVPGSMWYAEITVRKPDWIELELYWLDPNTDLQYRHRRLTRDYNPEEAYAAGWAMENAGPNGYTVAGYEDYGEYEKFPEFWLRQEQAKAVGEALITASSLMKREWV